MYIYKPLINTIIKKSIRLKKGAEYILPEEYFFHATNGIAADFRTVVSLKYTEELLSVNFNCEGDVFISSNEMITHNAPLYEQEVFEVFISASKEEATKYLEIEINPNNALWIGRISNPSLGSEMQILDEMIPYPACGIKHEVTRKETSWNGFLEIPWKLIGKTEKEYRLNFYRIRVKKAGLEKGWTSNKGNCDFVCWSPTMSGEEPAFHRPLAFGFLNLE